MMAQLRIASMIVAALSIPLADDPIRRCGEAPLKILGDRPTDVLQLAHERLHAWPYKDIPEHWRRLYEDACLYLAIADLERVNVDVPSVASIVKNLDKAIIVAGAPRRMELIEQTMAMLGVILEAHYGVLPSEHLHLQHHEPLITSHEIQRLKSDLSFAAFQQHLHRRATPIVIPHVCEQWRARQLWNDVAYLRKQFLYGYRVVPVEMGGSYVEHDWSQELIAFNDFADQYLLPDRPLKMGYLAQYDIFVQVPALKQDIQIPDYCWTTPPAPEGAAALTPGLSSTPQLDSPNVNAWLGPKGTRTPLHTDPYHNIFCQVVGYKYVRLYAPEESGKLYPYGVDEAGISLANTSQVDVSEHRARDGAQQSDVCEAATHQQEYPLFAEAKYQEAILGPGDSLYVPLGWWHYIEALTASFSVSFWWN